MVSPAPEEEEEEPEDCQGGGRPQREGRGEAESQLGLGDHPAGGLGESLAGPEQGNQPGPADLVQDGEGGVWPQDG